LYFFVDDGHVELFLQLSSPTQVIDARRPFRLGWP
jgi:hypothetical protein